MPHTDDASTAPLILAFGDSLIAGYGLAAQQAFPAQLQQRLRRGHPGAVVINAGVSGDTSADALRRLPRVLAGLSRRPDLAVVQIGPNDVLHGIAPARMRANLDALLTEFARCGIPVLLATVEPPAFLRARTTAYLGIHHDAAERHGARSCAFFPPDVLGHPDMVLADRVHPNALAITLVADAMAPVVEQALRATARAPA